MQKLNLIICLYVFNLYLTGFVYCKKLKIETLLKKTCERESEPGDILTIHYEGELKSTGEVFDSSYGRDNPISFQLGARLVMKGWDRGLSGMCPGDQRRLTIPPELAYGPRGLPDVIPPDSTVIFEIELVEITDGPPLIDMFDEINTDDDELISKYEVLEYLQNTLSDKQIRDYDPHDLARDIMRKQDADKNGFLTKDEFEEFTHDEF